MKKIFLSVMLTVLTASSVSFAEGIEGTGVYGAAGCGVGSMLLTKNSKVHQVFAATTNGILGNQTFGITSGTSNCTSEGLSKIDKEKEVFVEVNYATLQKEISQANGETLNSFAALMGCSEDVYPNFATTLQKNTKNLSAINNGSVFIETVTATVKADATLASKCTLNS